MKIIKVNMKRNCQIPVVLMLMFPIFSIAQIKNWHLKDKDIDGLYGISIEKAYDYLIQNELKKRKKIIVAIIDSGVDTLHEDLKSVLWRNHKELKHSTDGKDNDQNGYIDDKFGWNFLGGKDGKSSSEDSYEAFRVYHNLKAKFENADRVKPADYPDYQLWKRSQVEISHIAAKFEIKPDKLMKLLQTPPRDFRGEIVKDSSDDIHDRYYGNNDLSIRSQHGTNVSGIIGADHKNDFGIKGVADYVQLMIIRAVPNGDERDKDIALAIRYAVDNGAKVINMSFGKGLSPEKQWIDDAAKYAEKHDVLLIQAAGNNASNLDSALNFPTPKYLDGGRASNWITVGASGDPSVGDMIAGYSNYGKKEVDLFAPGINIYTTLPSNNYDFAEGTSMAAPVVSGVAALIRSRYPKFSAKEVKQILELTVLKPNMEVKKPGGGMVKFSDLCKSGGIVNAYEAVKLADQVTRKKKNLKLMGDAL